MTTQEQRRESFRDVVWIGILMHLLLVMFFSPHVEPAIPLAYSSACPRQAPAPEPGAFDSSGHSFVCNLV